jgi:hypothetical protein
MIGPGASCFKASRSTQDGLLSEATPNDLQADREATVREAHRNAGSRLTGEVEWVGEKRIQRRLQYLSFTSYNNTIALMVYLYYMHKQMSKMVCSGL